MERNVSTPAVICITGATDGIGKELAIQYLSDGYKGRAVCLILVGRRSLSELDRSFYTKQNYCQIDLAEPSREDQLIAWLDERNIEQLDLLIHNAGAGFVGPLVEQPVESITTLLQVNLYAPIALTHALIPKLKHRGTVAFVSSVASSLPSPEYATYSATKAAIDGLARNLRTEFNSPQSANKIDVKLILPGATKTNMHSKSGADLAKMGWEKFPPVGSVAAKIRIAIEGNRLINPIGWQNGLFRTLGRHAGMIIDPIIQRQFKQKYPHLTSPTLRGGDDSGPHAVVTGAADGIGKALTKQLLTKGYLVTGIDLDHVKAAEAQSELDAEDGRLQFIYGDLSNIEDVERISEELTTVVEQRGTIDLMVHNAGISAVGHFAEVPIERQQLVIDVNLQAPVLLTASTLRKQLMRHSSTFVFMSSLSFFAGYPGAAAYGASKDGIASFARSLGTAVAQHNINVLTVFPGPTRTAHARRYSPDNSREEKRMSPDELAERILAAVEKRKKRLVPGVGNQVAAVVGKFFPWVMDYAMRRVILDKLKP